ncbi:amidohydrolase family protein [Gordonia sp. CPCC 206044]|uniref:amidohydrolase family protein n=1 Tax=Gordonia sp. CPCC 206044 TaxID=3140793 RepID=UPI003AF38B33
MSAQVIVIRRAELPEGIRDVEIRDGRVAAVAPDLPAAGAEVVDGAGAALLPGLHDHHLHLHAMAAAAGSVSCGPPEVHTADELGSALRGAVGDSWIRGVGYVETVAGLLDSNGIDRYVRERPVRLQHRSGALWFLNSRAAELVGLAGADHPGIERDGRGAPTGRLWRADDWLRTRLPDRSPPDLGLIGDRLARFGITGVTDATPDLSPTSLRSLVEAHVDGALPQCLHLLGAPADDRDDRPHGITVGPYKIVLADSDLPDYQQLRATVHTVHEQGRAVAVHCVSRIGLLLLLAVFDDIGSIPGDRIEHGAVIPDESLDRIRGLGVCVVTQPGFIAHRGDDYLQRVDPSDVPYLYRCRSLMDNDIPVALSSDAPYGPADPWAVIAAARWRRAPDGRIVGADERISSARALDRYLTTPQQPGGVVRAVRVGEPADLVLLDRPRAEMLDDPSSDMVRCTMIRGRVAFDR